MATTQYKNITNGVAPQDAATIAQIATTVANKAALVALDVSQLTFSIKFVATYRDFFYLDTDVTRVAVPNEVFATADPSKWWVRMFIPSQYWRDQATWYVDPINGNDENEGDILADAIQTRSEYARRTDGQGFTQSVTINITSDLIASDKILPWRPQSSVGANGAVGYRIRYQGTKKALFTGTLTAVTNRNGATSTTTKLTCAGMSGTWSNSGPGATSLVGKIVEGLNGSGLLVSAVVVADLGSKQAWVSPPLQGPGGAETTFANGTVFTVYDAVNLSTDVVSPTVQTVLYQYSEFDYCRATQWETTGGYVNFTNCIGPLNAHGLIVNALNCQMNISCQAGFVGIGGGYGQQGTTAGTVGATLATVRPTTIDATVFSIFIGATFIAKQDVEVNCGSSSVSVFRLGGNLAKIILSGFCYGVGGLGTNIAQFDTPSRDCLLHFTNTPSLGGVTGVFFQEQNFTITVASLANGEVDDVFGNRAVGLAGPTQLLSVANKSALAALDSTHLGEGASRYVLTYRDWFDLDKTTSQSAAADTVVAASGGGWWVRRRLGSPSWRAQLAWTIDPVSGSDENLGDSGHPLQTRSEFYRRIGTSPLRDGTITVQILSDLTVGDVERPGFLSDTSSASAAFIKFIGTPRNLFTGTISAIVNRNGSASTHTSMTINSLPSTWTAGDGVTSFLSPGIVVTGTDGTNVVEARVVRDEGGKQAWLSAPMTRGNIESTFQPGSSVTIYDVPSLGHDEFCPQGHVEYTTLKVSGGRFFSVTGTIFHISCSGDVIAEGSSFSSSNGYSGIGVGQTFLVQGCAASITGGFHRLVIANGTGCRINVTPTLQAVQIESGATVATLTQTPGAPQVTPDLEFFNNVLDSILFNGVNGGRLIATGYVYGTNIGTSYGVMMQANGGHALFSHVPQIAGTNSGSANFLLTSTVLALSGLSTHALTDINDNVLIGPTGIWAAVANGATALALGSTGPNGLPANPVRYARLPDGIGGFFTVPSWT